MKKFVLILTLLVTVGLLEANAQEEKKVSLSNTEIGLRFGGEFSIDATVPIGWKPRLHPAIYFDRFGIASYLDWMWSLSGTPAGLKFYTGVGPEFYFQNDFDFDIAGNFGAEYAFNFPITVGIDWRPGFRTTDGFDFKTGNWGFTARFRFGEGANFNKAN